VARTVTATVHVHKYENGSIVDTEIVPAGGVLPEWAEVGDHLLDADPVGKPAGNASQEAWQDYAASQGVADGDIEGLSRDELRDKFGN